MANLLNTAKSVIADVTTHWNKPAKGNYIPYKEVLNLGVGGMGQQFIILLAGCMALSASNTLLGATLSLRPLDLQTLAIFQTVLNLVFYVIRGKIVDNTRTKYGRFRVYIAAMSFPIVILTSVFIFLPFETMNYNQKLMATFCFAIAVSMVQPFCMDSYTEIQSVMSPNSSERAKVITINALVYSIAPTITTALIPLLVTKTGGYTNIATYKYIYVPFGILGLALNLFTAFGCKERVIASKNYVQRIGVIEGCMQIYRNKHWWIRTVAGLVSFLEGAAGVLFSWIYIYGSQNMAQYSLLSTVLGSASGIGMFITPFVLKRLGNKNILIFHNLMNIIFLTIITFTFEVPVVMFVFLYANSLINSFAHIYNPVMHSEVKDYQQYISGARMDFMFGTAGLIFTPITLFTGYAIPFVYEYMGMTVDYDILYNTEVRNSLFLVLCLLSILGAVLNLLPFCFYSMSIQKHRNIVKALQYRALFDDYENNCLSDERIVECVEGIRETYKYVEAPDADFAELKKQLKEAKKGTYTSKKEKNEAIKNAKAAIKEAKRVKVEKQASYFLVDEIDKFKSKEQMHAVKKAKELAQYDIHQLPAFDKSIIDEAKAMPKSTAEERKIRKQDIKRAKSLVKMTRMINKYYPNGIEVPEEDMVEKAFNMSKGTAKEERARSRAVEKAEKTLLRYGRVMRPYLKAKELIKQERISQTILDDINKKYDEIVSEAKEG